MTIDHSPKIVSPLLPSTKCSLQIEHTTIQSHYSTTIRSAVAIPPLMQYLSEKTQWTQEISDDIDWESFEVAANNYNETDNHLLKLVYDQLPNRRLFAIARGSNAGRGSNTT